MKKRRAGKDEVLIFNKDLQEKRNGHVDVVREQLEGDDALVEKADTESESR